MCKVYANWRSRKPNMKITIETGSEEIKDQVMYWAGKRGAMKHEETDDGRHIITLNRIGYINVRANIEGLDALPHPDEMEKNKTYEIQKFEEYLNNKKIREVGIGNEELRSGLDEIRLDNVIEESREMGLI
ncbi:MAG: hypothetical protein J7K87_00020 [Candidatus Aenigmarchaeota archaeon]|nr:hypothetical protein [Candidatus Aenigmarchaeota archaeon]